MIVFAFNIKHHSDHPSYDSNNVTTTAHTYYVFYCCFCCCWEKCVCILWRTKCLCGLHTKQKHNTLATDRWIGWVIGSGRKHNILINRIVLG